uniref:UBA domain-containing protein 7 n=1 Tax=Cajanus cajan TaxID=3821 RepID=A0A151R5H1_CAJCA|nr:UBA domain-containing protein 7 [Cajanus cajan]
MPGEHPIKQGGAFFPCNSQSFEIQYQDNEYKESFKSSHLGFSRRVSSPETISLESNSYQSMKVSADDWELSSPFSAVSGLCQEPEAKSSVHDHMLPELVMEQDDDDEVMSSYVIEVNSNFREESCGTADIDEAIAWAKEKFQSRNSDEESSLRNEGSEQTTGVGGLMQANATVMEYEKLYLRRYSIALDKHYSSETSNFVIYMTHTRIFFLNFHFFYLRIIKIYIGCSVVSIKGTDILWPESGWYAVPLTNLLESSQVKKAYQKARLCLHPDKLQQRGATLLQKYVAEKAFSILQDAWTAFISEDVSF